MMDENLVGYLLHSLEPEEQRAVEAHLRAQPDAQRHLSLIRKALQPLAADREKITPPAGLWVRTLARVAEHRCRDLPLIPKAPLVRPAAPPRSWWRRADVLVAASLLLILLPLIPPGLSRLRYHQNLLSCQNNLRLFAQALTGYSDAHAGALPKVEALPPRNYAGVFVPILRDGQFLGPNVSVRCPARGLPPPPAVSLVTLEREQALGDRDFEEHVRNLAGCYAYVLGYRDPDGHHWGLRRTAPADLTERLPVMADRPPFRQNDRSISLTANSANHGGKGQNILYLGGNVVFSTKRSVGVGGNDIYLNINNRPEAGLNPVDAVLGGSEFKPYP
jgi:hypothetical protein